MMINKIFIILKRDFVMATRDAMLMYILVIPVLMAVGILLFAPGLNDTTVKFAMLETDNPEHIKFMQENAKVELFASVNDLERRINKRDDIAGLVPAEKGWEIVLQGNESELTEEYAKLLNSLYELGSTKENSTAEIISFGRTVPPLKTKLVNMLILLIIMLSGMVISISIVYEKSDNTISAMNVTPLSQTGFIIGKSLLGGGTSLISIILSILITGYYSINWIMIIIIGLSSMLLSFIIGFLQGISSEDIMEAAAGVKMLMLPIAGSIAGYELLSDKWQWTMYWSPFYWAYKANDEILSNTADWGSVMLSLGIILLLTLLMYAVLFPKIRKGFS